MAKSKRVPATLGYWPLLAAELKKFSAAWMGDPGVPLQIHRFAKDWKKVPKWGGTKVPGQDSLNSLIFMVYCAATYRPPFVMESTAKKRGIVGRANDAFNEQFHEVAQINVAGASEGIARAAFHADRFPWPQTPVGLPLLLYDYLRTYAEFPAFTTAWLNYTLLFLNNRKDNEVFVRVWLHTHHSTRHPDRPDKLVRWTDRDFCIKDICCCIKRDTDVMVSERTVRTEISEMCKEEKWCCPPPPRYDNPTAN